jgi:hypothetical protein
MFRYMGPTRGKTPQVLLSTSGLQIGKEVLLDLANLRDTNCELFWKRWPHLPHETDEDLLTLRDELRSACSPDKNQGKKLMHTLNRWIRWKPRNSEVGLSPLVVNGHWLSITPNPGNLRVSLGFALSDLHRRLFRCSNENCPQAFFIKTKRGQRFCDRPACKALGQREHKRAWWKKHGKEWLAARKSKKTGVARRRKQ